MGRSVRRERQLLTVDEAKLVEDSHHPALGLLSDKDLAELRKLVRERRDRARQIAARQRREMRGKADPRGAQAAADDTGSREKRDVLAAAMQRLNRETTRREAKAAREAMKDSVARALEMRRIRAQAPGRPASQTANLGIRAKEKTPGRARDGAKLGAISQHNKNMQAKRDNR
ncbi:hypothetical protein [Methylocapsa palsarum]|uniref:Uncharacterized protein n=1 Tax=Methylocapsa palsarum TaxID=1612308 RepID=A0A1I4CEH7_9HYPH|nr:hypothetical protein [Methylocapsa palsarum]SFK79612.1 hypothetical protein SAMN05444581_12149 [Methylocapsa palsarum]